MSAGPNQRLVSSPVVAGTEQKPTTTRHGSPFKGVEGGGSLGAQFKGIEEDDTAQAGEEEMPHGSEEGEEEAVVGQVPVVRPSSHLSNSVLAQPVHVDHHETTANGGVPAPIEVV